MKLNSIVAAAATTAVTAWAADSSSSRVERTYSTISPMASEIASAASNATTNHFTSNVTGAAFDRIVIVWLENTDYDKAAGQEDLKWLAQQGIVLDNYWGLTHPSEPNYIASVGGDYFALDDDRFIALPSNISTIVDLFDTKEISWSEYQEHLPHTGFQGFNYSNQDNFANDYVRKHNPLVMYDSVAQNETRLANIKNFTMFEQDLNDRTLPQYSFITPNMTNDGHDTNIRIAGKWSRDFLEPLLSNEYFMENTLVVLTFDENETYSIKNKVFTILLGGAVPDELKNTTDSTYYDHYSLISSPVANWDLPSLGRHDVDANVFELVANVTNITNKDVDTTYKLNNATYVGYLLDDQIALPAPNVTAINRNGRGVLQQVVDQWGDEYSAQMSASYFTSTTTTVSASVGDAATMTLAGNSSTLATSSATQGSNSTTHPFTSTGAGAVINALSLSSLIGMLAVFI
ncbi:hypothetical protein HG535_0H03670 [Zygotorulaspora mrakii]|uniref:acid phosphatase n=1 Tax=Zygotorulaspora mrakii TaxID=42260 RepID=A0A7H9B9A9_ZYGMR|nr:uncharacterized protein HG535_0H03670 [Zygotorulaspora mrakii]QLG75040.1 hypothetical protein HG535_0H03670 [Zygotorulaspora mrakii]